MAGFHLFTFFCQVSFAHELYISPSINLPFSIFSAQKKNHLLISWLFRVIKGVILFAPQTSDPNGKRSLQQSILRSKKHFLTALSRIHFFVFWDLIYSVVVVAISSLWKREPGPKKHKKHLNDQRQIQTRFWLFNTEVLVSPRISANWFLIRFFAKYWWYVENWWFPLNQDVFVNLLQMERLKKLPLKGSLLMRSRESRRFQVALAHLDLN